MSDEERTMTYVAGIHILAFLSQWRDGERLGVKAKIYNTITKKHNVFHKQIFEMQRKKKKCSEKCHLFIEASDYSIKSWNKATKDTKSLTISVSTTIRNIFNLSKENFTKIYGLKEEDFIKFDQEEGVGSKAFSSCKMGRILIDYAKEEISNNERYDVKVKKCS